MKFSFNNIKLSPVLMSLVIIVVFILSPIQIGATDGQNSFTFSKDGPPSFAEWEQLQSLPLKKLSPKEEWPAQPAPLGGGSIDRNQF